MSFPRYPAYKDSGVEWLGEVPVGWDLKKFRHLFRESPEKIENEVIGPMLSVSGYRGIEIKEYDDENRRRSQTETLGYRVVRVGQLVVNTMWLNYAGLGVSAYEGHVSPAYRAYSIAKQLNRDFVHHLLRSGIYVQGYTRLLTGVRPNSLQMSRDDLMEFPVLVPEHRDQLAIAAFLDRETAKIDALVAEQQRLIALLKEKRQAVISHAVTKGLNADAPMKDSGVEWLGEVPAHWTVAPIKVMATIGNGSTPSRERPDFWIDAVYPWLNSAVVNYDPVAPAEQFVSPVALRECHLPIVHPPAVVVGITGQGRTRGMASVLLFEATVSQHLAFLKPKDRRMDVFFLRRVLEMAYVYLRRDSDAAGSTKGAITCEELGNFKLACPPEHEQLAIVVYANRLSDGFDALTAAAERAIELLHERRTALISAAVTGQIDVRSVAVAEAAA